MTELYDGEHPLMPAFTDLAGPKGPALVKVWPDGKTDIGWGLQGPRSEPERGFMPRYLADDFNARRVLHGYERNKWAFAVVMRSVRLLAVDIDGKNGGIEHAKKLGMLPPTMAETSKSGNGYHLFFETPEDWHVEEGYGLYSDHIGIVQGVDIRAVGCIYHHKQQRWNDRAPAKLPEHLHDLMLARRQKQISSAQHVGKVIATGDELEVMMLHDGLLTDLRKPIMDGKRNTTLFAIGQKMKQAGTPDWEQHIADRASEVGLDGTEITQLVKNIGNYN